MFNVRDIVDYPIEKSDSPIVSAEPISLCDMTLQDWENLDWYEIRDVAKNRISELLFAGLLIGFIAVKYPVMPFEPETATRRAGSGGGGSEDDPPRRKRKPAYYHPHRGGFKKAVATEDISEEDIEQIRREANEPEEEPSENTNTIDEYIEELQSVILYPSDAIIGLIYALRRVAACSGMLSIIENGLDERGYVWAFVLLTALIVYFGFDRAFEMIEEEF